MSVKRRSMQGVVAGVARAGEELVNWMAASLESRVVPQIPVRTGHTKSTARVEKDGRGVRFVVGGAMVWIEFGTSRRAARPIVRSNLRAVRKEFRPLSKKAIRDNLKGGLKG